MKLPVFYPPDPLISAIVEVLVYSSHLTVMEIKKQVEQTYNISYTRQHFYRVVSQLCDSGVLVRVDKKITLDMLWTSSLHAWTQKCLQKVTASSSIQDFQLEAGESRVFVADTFRGLTTIHNQMIVSLVLNIDTPYLYQYHSHLYLTLERRDPESFYNILSSTGKKFISFVSNDTFLDKWSIDYIKKNHKDRYIEIVEHPYFPKNGYKLQVLGDYIIEQCIPDVLEANFNLFFKTTSTIDNFNKDLYSKVFDRKVRCQLEVRRNKDEAEKMKNIMESMKKSR